MPIVYSIQEIMEMAVETEKGGKLFYETVGRDCKDKKLKDLFAFLADEESKHIQVFEEIARSVKTPAAEVPFDWEEVSAYLRSLVESRYFLGKDKALALARECPTTEKAIVSAIGFEKETLLFYLEVVDMVSGANRRAVDRLIAEERAHVRRLASFAAACKP